MRRIAWSRIIVIATLVIIGSVLFMWVRPMIDGRDGAEPGVYAFVGSEPVYHEDIERSYAQRNSVQENLSLEEFFEETYAPRTMLLLEARTLNLSVTDDEVDAWIDMINRTLMSRNTTFEMYLEDLNVTYDQLRDDIRSSTLLDKVLEVIVAREVVVTAQEVQEAYDAAGYASLGIPIEQARNEIGPMILREKQDAHLREVVERLRDEYDVVIV